MSYEIIRAFIDGFLIGLLISILINKIVWDTKMRKLKKVVDIAVEKMVVNDLPIEKESEDE